MTSISPSPPTSKNTNTITTTDPIVDPSKLDATAYNDGQVAVKTGTGLIKIRKGQSEESYLEQRNQFWQSGPLLNTNTWLDDYLKETVLTRNLQNLHISKKDGQDGRFEFDKVDKVLRERIFRGLEKLYFERDYSQCLKCCDELVNTMHIPSEEELQTKKFKLLKKILADLRIIRERCEKKLDN